MKRQDHVAAVAAEFASGLGIANAAFDESGRLTLMIDDMAITLAYEIDPIEALALTADLGTLVNGAAPPRMLLETSLNAFLANLMTISLAENGASLRARTAIPAATLSLPVLQDVAYRFIDAALETRNALSNATPEPALPPTPTDTMPHHGGMIRG